jgi:RNA polymerase sigma-70 factor, ECF subfamily
MTFEVTNMEQGQLIAAARDGDQDAFAELYRRHHGYVRAIGRSILRTEDLDDMCQETFLSAFTRLETFEGNAQFRTWLSRIALNRCLIILRSQRRFGLNEVQCIAIDDYLEHPGLAMPDRHLEGVANRLDVEHLLRQLTGAQREALEMAFVEEMPAHEIALALDITVAGVKGRIAVARKKLKKLLER